MNDSRAAIKPPRKEKGRTDMFGRMQEWPLLMHKIIDFAAIQFPTQ